MSAFQVPNLGSIPMLGTLDVIMSQVAPHISLAKVGSGPDMSLPAPVPQVQVRGGRSSRQSNLHMARGLPRSQSTLARNDIPWVSRSCPHYRMFVLLIKYPPREGRGTGPWEGADMGVVVQLTLVEARRIVRARRSIARNLWMNCPAVPLRTTDRPAVPLLSSPFEREAVKWIESSQSMDQEEGIWPRPKSLAGIRSG